MFHFAGHGYTDRTDPLQSRLLLEDWRSDPMVVDDFLQINMRENSPFLAYLSACGTGQTASDEHLDESIHLISAFQLVGFRHVIGTLWEVDDAKCVDMARLVYEHMSQHGMTDESVCQAVNDAARELRNRWIKEHDLEKNLDSVDVCQRGKGLPRDAGIIEEVEELERPSWVPYIHIST